MLISVFIISGKQNHEIEMWYKQKPVIEFLTLSEKPKKIHKCLKVVYGEDVFDVSTVCYWAREVQKNIKITKSRRSKLSKNC